MKDSAQTFTHANTARQYIALYERMLKRRLIVENMPNPDACKTNFDREV